MILIIIFIIVVFLETPMSALIWLMMLWALHITLAVLVSNNAKLRNLDNGRLWGVLTFFMGLPVALLFALLNIKLGTKVDDKKLRNIQRNALIACAVTLVISAAVTPLYLYEYKQARLQEEYNYAEKEAFLNADGTHYVCYDKAGNEYEALGFDEYDNSFKYYTRDGVALEWEDYSGEVKNYDYTKDYYRYISADGKVKLTEERALINEDGYMVEVNKNKLEHIWVSEDEDEVFGTELYKDKKGNLYFIPYDCSWDKDGNLVFKSQEINDFYNEHK